MMTHPDSHPDDGAEASQEGGSTDSLEARLQDAEARAEENRLQCLQRAAELDNYRKRAAREVESARQYGAERLAAALLPALDSLELGLQAAATADAATLAEGERATLRLLHKALEACGVTGLDPVGEPFDPERHEALTMQPSPDAAPNTVLAVVQKGYVLNGRLLRPARVVVASAPSA